VIKRLDIVYDEENNAVMVEHPTGDYLTFEDHQRVVQQLEDRIANIGWRLEQERYR